MKVVVFGANGKTGREVVEQCKKQGWSVRTFVHSDHGVHKDVEVVEGDVTNDLKQAVKGCQLAFYCIGHGTNTPENVVTEGMKQLLKAGSKLKKIIAVSGAQVHMPQDNDNWWSITSRQIFSTVAPARFWDGQHMSDLLMNSKTNYVIIRSPRMTKSGLSEFKLSEKPAGLEKSVPHKSSAKAMIEAAKTTHWDRKAPFISQS